MALPVHSPGWLITGCRIIAMVAVLAVGSATAVMNARFGFMLGEDPLAKQVLMVFSVAVDVFKWLAPVLAALAWQQGAKLRAVAAGMLWLTAGAWSFAAAIGFSALNRDVTVAGRTAVVGSTTRAGSTWQRADQTLTTLLASPRWTATKACTEATTPASVAYCIEVKDARAALAAADAVLKDAPPVTSADPQADFFARTFGMALPRAQLGLTLFLALVAELFSMFGMFVASAPAASAIPVPVEPVLPPEPTPDPPPAAPTPVAAVPASKSPQARLPTVSWPPSHSRAKP